MLLFFIDNVLGLMFCITVAGIEPTTLPRRKCSTNHIIPSNTAFIGLFFRFIANTKSEREFLKKPCCRTTQFSAGLHCQALNQRPDRAR